MKLRSDFREALTNMQRLHRESGEERDLNQFTLINAKRGIRRLLHPVHLGGSGMNIGGAQKLKNVNCTRAREMSGITEQGDLFWILAHQDTQSAMVTRICLLKSGNSERLLMFLLYCIRKPGKNQI